MDYLSSPNFGKKLSEKEAADLTNENVLYFDFFFHIISSRQEDYSSTVVVNPPMQVRQSEP